MRKRKHGKKCPIYYKHISPITLQRKVTVEKDVFSSCHERGIEKNSESPRGIELQIFGFASIGAQIRRSEVRFPMVTQNFSLSHARDKTKKHVS